MMIKMISLRNFEPVARVFHFASLLKSENEPTHELVSNVAARNITDTLRYLIFIIVVV